MSSPESPGQPHPMERLLDNTWLLLVLGVVVPTLSYTVWGWIEIALMGEAKLQ